MFLSDGVIVCSPSDLTAAIACEFEVLRRLDVTLGRVKPGPRVENQMTQRVAELGNLHEKRTLEQLQAKYGPYNRAAGTGVYSVARAAVGGRRSMQDAAAETLAVLRSGADVVFQAALMRGRFVGYPDFLVREPDSPPGRPVYAVHDAKLSRTAKTAAWLQLAAYADELAANGITVSSQVHLMLGDGSEVSRDTAELITEYRDRRRRVEAMLDEHLGEAGMVAWGDVRYAECGRCDTCTVEVAGHRDLRMVAGMLPAWRRRLRDAGVHTIDALAAGSGPVEAIYPGHLDPLRAQAALQVRQRPPRGAAGAVLYDVFHPRGLSALPPPDPGDIFFDFEGDPFWSDKDRRVSGLEYLFGVIELDQAAGAGEHGASVFRPFWAHDRAQEKLALHDFLAYVTKRRIDFPGMHIYHYASYEQSALVRLSVRYGIDEDVVGDLIEAGILVDLHKVVRASLRVSQPSYGLKMLEPLYMGDELRGSQVKNGGDSTVAYAEYCALRDRGDAARADRQLREIADYNEYDCLSTLRLRDWLLTLAAERNVDPVGRRLLKLSKTYLKTAPAQALSPRVADGG